MLTVTSNKIIKLNKNQLLRTTYTREAVEQAFITINKKKLLNFASNDYLGLSQHPIVKQACHQGIDLYGAGSTGSAQLTGYTKAHRQLEENVADFLGREKALLFNSGYHANISIFEALSNRDTTIFADKECHASIIDGIKLSRAKLYRYHHQNLAHLETRLIQHGDKSSRRYCDSSYIDNNAILVSESIFSMDGSVTDIRILSSLAKQHHAMLVIDDAHGIGILGDVGKGASEKNSLVDCLVTPLGKSIGGMGAIVSGCADMIDALKQLSRSYRYSTALPPAICMANTAAISILQKENWRTAKLMSLIQFFISESKKRNLPLMSQDNSPIKTFLIKDNSRLVLAQATLMKKGIYAACIRPPTVPANSARIRISLSCVHSEEHIIYLLDHLQAIL